MDAGASIVAFIGLVGLVTQSTTSLIQLCKDIKNTPNEYQSNLKWLEQLILVLNGIESTCSNIEKAKIAVDLGAMKDYLNECDNAIAKLRTQIEEKLAGLNRAGFERRKATLKAFFASKRVNCQIQDIRRAMEGLSLCHNTMIGHITIRSHGSVQDLPAQMNELSLSTQRAGGSLVGETAGFHSHVIQTMTELRQDVQQLQHSNMGTLRALQNLQAGHEWMATAVALLPLEIQTMVCSAVTEELKSTGHVHQTLKDEPRRQTLAFSSSMRDRSISKRTARHPASHSLSRAPVHQSWEQFQEMEDNIVLPCEKADKERMSPSSNRGEQWKCFRSKILMFSWYYRASFGYVSVVVHERQEGTAESEETLLHADIKIFPPRWVSARAIQAHIFYRAQGFSSPMDIQLDFPRVLSLPDNFRGLIYDKKSDKIIELIKSGVYRPNDLWDGFFRFRGPMSLLTLASYYGLVELVRFLLQQGARVDQSLGSGAQEWIRIPETIGSDLKCVLSSCTWSTASESTADLIAWAPPADRLNIIRLLVKAGSEVSNITLSTLAYWVVVLDIETVFGVFTGSGNIYLDVDLDQDDTHWFFWDPFEFRLSGTSLDMPIIERRLEKFSELCERLNLNLALTASNGLNMLHRMMGRRYQENYARAKRYLVFFISNGVDPCAVCEEIVTPTLIAFFTKRMGLWFSALAAAGIGIEHVAAHALSLVDGSRDESAFESDFKSEWKLHPWWVINPGSVTPSSSLRSALIEDLKLNGCSLDILDKGNVVTYKTSSAVDYIPSTMYDPERAKQDVRRRVITSEDTE